LLDAELIYPGWEEGKVSRKYCGIFGEKGGGGLNSNKRAPNSKYKLMETLEPDGPPGGII